MLAAEAHELEAAHAPLGSDILRRAIRPAHVRPPTSRIAPQRGSVGDWSVGIVVV